MSAAHGVGKETVERPARLTPWPGYPSFPPAPDTAREGPRPLPALRGTIRLRKRSGSMNRLQLCTDMARDINQAFILAGADFIIPRADIDTETVRASYRIPLNDLHKLATVEMRLLCDGFALNQVSSRVSLSRLGLRGTRDANGAGMEDGMWCREGGSRERLRREPRLGAPLPPAPSIEGPGYSDGGVQLTGLRAGSPRLLGLRALADPHRGGEQRVR